METKQQPIQQQQQPQRRQQPLQQQQQQHQQPSPSAVTASTSALAADLDSSPPMGLLMNATTSAQAASIPKIFLSTALQPTQTPVTARLPSSLPVTMVSSSSTSPLSSSPSSSSPSPPPLSPSSPWPTPSPSPSPPLWTSSQQDVSNPNSPNNGSWALDNDDLMDEDAESDNIEYHSDREDAYEASPSEDMSIGEDGGGYSGDDRQAPKDHKGTISQLGELLSKHEFY
ncbi:proline-rich receptor-like protein kinase PERK8 [Drosophila obscura]|uniref:proline-rich receptor-like protein kinase PERK8 n=1 Tax=Drosophila obscura TaxID=7282 RepID=UPI001BB10AF3|nr:proline-rich receptor-like protein kinase PERK8 [Drosophila obscura]